MAKRRGHRRNHNRTVKKKKQSASEFVSDQITKKGLTVIDEGAARVKRKMEVTVENSDSNVIKKIKLKSINTSNLNESNLFDLDSNDEEE